MNRELAGKRVAILVADGFEQCELTGPRQALDEAGADTWIVSLAAGQVVGWQEDHFEDAFLVDLTVGEAAVDRFDALLLPGGVLNPDTLRASEVAVRFVREFFRSGKPVAALCHGLQTAIETGAVRDRMLTSLPSVRTDLLNAGAKWVDAAVVVDRGLVTSRGPGDLRDFTTQMIGEFAGGRAR